MMKKQFLFMVFVFVGKSVLACGSAEPTVVPAGNDSPPAASSADLSAVSVCGDSISERRPRHSVAKQDLQNRSSSNDSGGSLPPETDLPGCLEKAAKEPDKMTEQDVVEALHDAIRMQDADAVAGWLLKAGPGIRDKQTGLNALQVCEQRNCRREIWVLLQQSSPTETDNRDRELWRKKTAQEGSRRYMSPACPNGPHSAAGQADHD